MKRRLLAIGGAMALLGTTATVGILAQAPPPVPSLVAFRQHRERHPELALALRDLQNAQAHLQLASRDFHSHRAKAAQLVKQAIAQTRLAIRSDRH